MMIFLGFVGELATIIGSCAIIAKGSVDLVIKLCEHGFKVNQEAFNKYQKQKEMKQSAQKKKINAILGTIILLLPGVNLVRAAIMSHKMLKDTLKNAEAQKFLIPMTEKEKEQFTKLETTMEKLAFASVATVGNEDEEYFGLIGKKPIVVDHGLTSIYHEQLLPLAYTLDEVKELNSVTGFSYRLGKVDGINTAIVGIPNPNSLVKRLNFKAEDYKQTYTFEEMTEEEAQDKTFVVYPLTKEEEVLACVEKIRENRHDKRFESVTPENLEFESRLEELLQKTLEEEAKSAPVEKAVVLEKSIYPNK